MINKHNGYTGFTSINIPNSVDSIGSNAFERCYSISSVSGDAADWIKNVINSGNVAAKNQDAYDENPKEEILRRLRNGEKLGRGLAAGSNEAMRGFVLGTWKVYGAKMNDGTELNITLTIHDNGTVTGTASYSHSHNAVAWQNGKVIRYVSSAKAIISGTWRIVDNEYKQLRHLKLSTHTNVVSASHKANGVPFRTSYIKTGLEEAVKKALNDQNYEYKNDNRLGFVAVNTWGWQYALEDSTYRMDRVALPGGGGKKKTSKRGKR